MFFNKGKLMEQRKRLLNRERKMDSTVYTVCFTKIGAVQDQTKEYIKALISVSSKTCP
jgi:hypothetical protein